jgi:hypothetical protein
MRHAHEQRDRISFIAGHFDGGMHDGPSEEEENGE